MDADDLTVRTVMAVLSFLGLVSWVLVFRYADRMRTGNDTRRLRSRAIVCLSYAVNLCAMSIVIVTGMLHSGRLMGIWRNVTRLHAALVLLVLACELLYNEVRRRG